jgi:hypothetical protein
MAYVTRNGFDVEHASSLLVMENLFPAIQHINGMGVTDKYTKTSDIENVTLIDVMRVLPYAPRFRQLGATNNGAWSNAKNDGRSNAPQSQHYTIPVDLIYDEGVPVTKTIAESNPIQLQAIVMKQVVEAAALSINVVTYAKQIEGWLKNYDDTTGALKDATNYSDFGADDSLAANVQGSYADAFINANGVLTDGVKSIGAFVVDVNERQAFATTKFNRIMKRQYMTNASTPATHMLSNGVLNPFNDTEAIRINEKTGYLGVYDGVDIFLFNSTVKKFVYDALGLTASDTTEIALLDKIACMIVYANATVRGIVGPTVEVNPNVYYGGAYLLPKLKMGVEVVAPDGIKMIVDAANGFTAANILALKAKVKFTPLDGSVVAPTPTGFNDGTSM